MMLSGPPILVLQFFRYYGHPKLDCARKIVQFIAIILTGSLFLIELLLSIMWLP